MGINFGPAPGTVVLPDGKIILHIFKDYLLQLNIPSNVYCSIIYPKTLILLSDNNRNFYRDVITLLKTVEYLKDNYKLLESNWGKDNIVLQEGSPNFGLNLQYQYGDPIHKGVLETISLVNNIPWVTASVINLDGDTDRYTITLPLIQFLQFSIIPEYDVRVANTNIQTAILQSVDETNNRIDKTNNLQTKYTFVERVLMKIRGW